MLQGANGNRMHGPDAKDALARISLINQILKFLPYTLDSITP